MGPELVIYGSYGYTGRLVVAEAIARGHRPLLAGRDPARLGAQATEAGLPHTVVDLGDPEALRRLLSPAVVALHCAGPFVHTSRPLVDACLATGTHYLDITGEIAVFEQVAARDGDARAADVVLMPGVGFDVVPSDSLAAHLKRALPDAVALELAIRGGGRLSRGTATTMVENIGAGGAVRRDGHIKRVSAGWRSRMVDFGDGPTLAVTIPWGDVSTAWHTTGIPDITVYAASSRKQLRLLRASNWLAPLLRTGPVQRYLKKRVDAAAPGPSDDSRGRTTSDVWGEARSADGRSAQAVIRGPNGYTLTALTSVRIAEVVAAGGVAPGFHTPAGALGPDFVLSVPGISRSG
ncbi:MAG: saccharopine dehydrogenase NADP-binding domain-containing protein [Xanthomonadaceae bacterium]|nr:saccharopine dehydrogenase NADP-binding domain-containing protein [Xanthomonadaceae bacterium]